MDFAITLDRGATTRRVRRNSFVRAVTASLTGAGRAGAFLHGLQARHAGTYGGDADALHRPARVDAVKLGPNDLPPPKFPSL